MPSPTTRRLILWIPALLIVGIVIAILFRPVAVPIDLVTVERGAISVTITDEGKTRVKDVFVVSAPVPGLMRRIELEPGDQVTAGETIVARIEPSDPSFLDVRTQAEAQAAVRAAEAAEKYAAAQVRRAEAELDFANAEFARYRGLAERNTVSENDLDAAERRARTSSAALEEAKANLNVGRSQLEQARAKLMAPNTERSSRGADCECINAYSPVSGAILRVLKKSEGVVASGAPLVEIGDPSRLEIVVDLLSTDAVRVEVGQRVLIEAWGGSPALEGTVTRIEPFGFTKISALGIEEQRVNVRIDLVDSPDHWARLGHGYRVEPRIILAEASDILTVPRAALFRDGDQWAVFVAENDTAVLRIVELGLSNAFAAEITSGLAVGERVVLQPSDRVSAGSRLQPR
ncbi:MAG: HlyD family efflux transporter periplasmic adaptor subunit [Gammaproteobacteria bacterium]|nr:efflux transporter periplasmic adaptor subunit [Chromatiales bacterium]MDP6673288.1 HlyD family efflux transporter periplasmic adaptor subunit [Gammaproteobacteria bacterium]